MSGYVRPEDLDNENTYALILQPFLSAVSATPHDYIIGLRYGRQLAISYWHNPAWDLGGVYGTSAEVRNGPSGPVSTSGLQQNLDPDESEFILPAPSIDEDDMGSSQATVFYDPGWGITDDAPHFTLPLTLRLPRGAMEVFEVGVFGPPPPPPPPPDPRLHILPCDPVPRRPFPYLDPFMAAASGPPGIVRRVR